MDEPVDRASRRVVHRKKRTASIALQLSRSFRQFFRPGSARSTQTCERYAKTRETNQLFFAFPPPHRLAVRLRRCLPPVSRLPRTGNMLYALRCAGGGGRRLPSSHVPTTHNVPSLDPSPMWRLPVTGSGALCGATTQSYFDRLRGVTGRPELRAVQHNARPPSLHAVQHDAHAEARRPVPGRMNWPHASRRRRAHPAGRHRRSSISCSL